MGVLQTLKYYRSSLKFILFGLFISLLGLLIVVGYIAFVIYDYGYFSSPHKTDAALVLGAAAWGEKPSPVFKERINHAIDLYREKQVKILIFTGGTPRLGYPTEAAVARRYAIAKGVPFQDIIIEEESRTTYANILNASLEVKPFGVNSFLIVSDPIHMKRAMLMAKDLKLVAYPSPTPSSRYQSFLSQAHFLAREVQNYIAYRLFWHIS